MNKKTTYKPDDIEQLLLNKSYEELSTSEKNFADSQVDSPAEYNELRATLVSIKQLAQEEEIVEVSPRIKEDLMQLMEEKANRVPWYTWNGIAAFLFPTNTPLFRKPGLQFAVMGLLLLLVVNIGLNSFDNTSNQLAINTKSEAKEPKKSIETQAEGESSFEPIAIEEIEKVVEEQKQYNNGEKSDNDIEDKIAPPPTPGMVEKVQVLDDAIDFATEENEDEIIAPIAVKDAKAKTSTLSPQPNMAKEESVVEVQRTTDSYNAVTLSEVSVPENDKSFKKKRKTVSNSQSLSEQDAVIDLLFVAL